MLLISFMKSELDEGNGILQTNSANQYGVGQGIDSYFLFFYQNKYAKFNEEYLVNLLNSTVYNRIYSVRLSGNSRQPSLSYGHL